MRTSSLHTEFQDFSLLCLEDTDNLKMALRKVSRAFDKVVSQQIPQRKQLPNNLHLLSTTDTNAFHFCLEISVEIVYWQIICGVFMVQCTDVLYIFFRTLEFTCAMF